MQTFDPFLWKEFTCLSVLEQERGDSFLLTSSFPCTLSLPPENIRKPYSFLMFPGDRGRVHWERMGWLLNLQGCIQNQISFERKSNAGYYCLRDSS